ncbi:LOW QUALITY PROTEIN: signal recognition particle 14 kDa protein-like [Perognathus longimembris pacificus]|uniref:LOW QUALITY PROTEIN: signal recognition particle 14 kDa protein-like n=1 Tax=Perognathus longimembris pacificus TaxID=214514 RepID=UPI0020191919|nr:LOW QUALITY PROTEIN: signal recognition particle 14 kDa protein-like [Perognathus longimembris pacificus]
MGKWASQDTLWRARGTETNKSLTGRAATVLLESEQLLMELTRLFQKCRPLGSVFITLKKYDGRTKPIPRKGSVGGLEPTENKCLLRATDEKKKISTVVSSKEVNKFQMHAYSNLLRANLDGLKKRDKKNKNKKTKTAQ